MSFFRFLCAAIATFMFGYAGRPASAGTLRTLYNFPDGNTGSPTGKLYLRDGVLYGTGSGLNSAHGDGQVFQLTRSDHGWKFKTLLAFNGKNGALPRAGVVADKAGVLYGTTSSGGAYSSGTVFKLWNSGGRWKSKTLQNFAWNDAGGSEPESDLVIDASGALIGTTVAGGVQQAGTVFSVVPSAGHWREDMLYRFGNDYDGASPTTGVLRIGNNRLYGTTYRGGGLDYGTVFELRRSPMGWTEKRIHSFGGALGEYPINGLVKGSDGALYGTTLFGGAFQYGTVFSLKRSGQSWTYTVIHDFGGGDDGQEPYGGLLRVGDTLYGTAEFGGAHGVGIIFSLAESDGTWTETVLHNFTGGAGGGYPTASPIADGKGNLYGATFQGNGTVWEFSP